jgi:hypothetical protein
MVGGTIREDEFIHIKRNPWTDNFFRPLLITIMIMCLSISMVNLVRLINPAWSGTYFLVGMLITTIEAIYSYRVLHHYRGRGVSVLRYRLAEAVVLILILKFLSLVGKPLSVVQAELVSIWQSPTAFLSVEFYVLVILAWIAWLAATNTIADFEALYDPYSDNRVPLDSLATRFFWGGGVLLLISGITQWASMAGFASLADWRRPLLSGVIFNVLIYFVLGLVLLSQVNLTTLRVRWRMQKITVSPGLVRQWVKYGVVFLLIVGLIAFLLPTRYSLGFLATAGIVVRFLIEALLFLVQLLILLMTLPFSWLLSLLGGTPLEPQAGPPAAPPPVVNAQPSSAPPWLEILQSLFFWLVALAVMGYLIKSYLDDHPELLQQLRRFKLAALIFRLLSQIWAYVGGLARAGLDNLPKIVISQRKDEKNEASLFGRWNWLGLRNLSPRERILYYYLSILRQAANEGLARQEHETPYEYEPNLVQSAPNVQREIKEITDSFVKARYSAKTFGQEDVSTIKQQWRRIRKALRQPKGHLEDR